MKLAYIAGPFRAANAWQRAQNIREAEQVGMAVTWLGVMPIIPHANTGNFDGTLDDAFWLEGTLEMMRRCDLVVCTDRWTQSKGAQAEVAEALRLNMPVYIYADGEYRTHVPGQPWEVLQPWELKAIIEADWKREITIDPSTNSISATLATCSAPVPEILSRMCTANQRVTIEARTDGMPVYKVPESLQNVTVEELAKMGLKPKTPLPSDRYLHKCGHYSIHKQWCTKCAADIVAISQQASHPEPPPTGDGDLVTPPLIEALADYPELAALVSARDAFGRSKYGTGLRTHNGRDPLEDARQELGDLLQYVWQAKMEGQDIHPFLDLWSKAYSAIFPHDERDKWICKYMLEYVEAVRDVTTGSKPASRSRAEELYTAIKQDMLEGDPRMCTVVRLREMMGPAPTIHPRPFWWDSNERFGFVNVPDGYVTEPERMTLAQLIECVPNALDAHESHHRIESGQYPRFGFRLEHTGPRTLREYLEAP